MFNTEEDLASPIEDVRLALKTALVMSAPVTQIDRGRTGNHHPLDIVLSAADGTATAYFERVLCALPP